MGSRAFSKIWLIAILAVLITGGVLAWQYLWTPEQDETADWKVYRNEEYGYEVRYPGDWYLEENTVSITIIQPQQRKEGEYFDSFRSIDIAVYPTKSDWPSFDKEWIYERKEKLIIGGIEGEEIWQHATKGAGFRHILFSKGERLYLVTTYQQNPHMEIFNQMLSTFKFLE